MVKQSRNTAGTTSKSGKDTESWSTEDERRSGLTLGPEQEKKLLHIYKNKQEKDQF